MGAPLGTLQREQSAAEGRAPGTAPETWGAGHCGGPRGPVGLGCCWVSAAGATLETQPRVGRVYGPTSTLSSPLCTWSFWAPLAPRQAEDPPESHRAGGTLHPSATGTRRPSWQLQLGAGEPGPVPPAENPATLAQPQSPTLPSLSKQRWEVGSKRGGGRERLYLKR